MFDHELLVHRSGRTLYLTWLHHEWTYAHHYEGRLSLRLNEGTVEYGRRTARRIQAGMLAGKYEASAAMLSRIEPHVLPLPAIERALSQNEPVEALPPVLCAAVLDSTAGIQRAPDEYSNLVIVWFQDRIPMPIADEALAAMAKLDWDALAMDWSP